MHVYSVVHAPPVPGAPEPLSTVVSPTALAPDAIVGAVAPKNPTPIQGWRPYELTYPEVALDPSIALEQVRARYDNCARCHLAESRTYIVHFRGNPYSPVVAIGEGPGRDEDTAGLPFVGRSGRLQVGLFQEGGIDPDRDLGWLNLVGCRPCNTRWDGDREPSLVEKVACSERFVMLMRALRPRIILCLGKEAAHAFFGPDLPPVNSWATLQDPAHPLDWVQIAYLRHPAFFLRAIAVPNNYKEYFAAKLFYEALKARLPGLQKTARWCFGLRYLQGIGAPLVGP